jgi:hypothetical protein
VLKRLRPFVRRREPDLAESGPEADLVTVVPIVARVERAVTSLIFV